MISFRNKIAVSEKHTLKMQISRRCTMQINIHMYPYFLFAAIHHLKSCPTFSVWPCSSVGRVTEDLIRRSGVRFPPRSKDFFFASCGSLFPFTRANAQWVIHGLSSTIIYTSELILWFHYLCSQFYAAQHSYVPLLSRLCLDTRQPGSVFKILHTRQSEIFLEFPRKNSSNPSLNCRSLFRNVKRFQL